MGNGKSDGRTLILGTYAMNFFHISNAFPRQFPLISNSATRTISTQGRALARPAEDKSNDDCKYI